MEKGFSNPEALSSSKPTIADLEIKIPKISALVLSPKDGARARNRSLRVFDYEHEHHFIEHEHE